MGAVVIEHLTVNVPLAAAWGAVVIAVLLRKRSRKRVDIAEPDRPPTELREAS